MSLLILYAFGIVFLNTRTLGATTSELIELTFDVHEGKKFPTILNGVIDVHSLTHCAYNCLKFDCCLASYDETLRQCYITDSDNATEHFIHREARSGWISMSHKMPEKIVYNTKMNWTDARVGAPEDLNIIPQGAVLPNIHTVHYSIEWDFCANRKQRLATVSSACEHEYMKSLVRGSLGFWIDGTDSISEGDWFLSNPTRPLTQLFWSGHDEPNGNRSENCLNYYNFISIGPAWNDANCGYEMDFVCENFASP